MFCRYCGKQIPDGSMCDCPDAVKNRKIQQAAPQPEQRRPRPQQAAPQPQRAPQPKPVTPKKKDNNTGFYVSVIFAVLALIVYFLCRYAILGAVKGSGAAVIMVYVTYFLPVILAVVALICAGISASKSSKKGKNIVMMILSFVIAVFVLVNLVVMMKDDQPTEPEAVHTETAESEKAAAGEADVETDAQTDAQEVQTGANPLFADKLASYESGLDDYVSIRTWLSGIDQTALSDADKLAYAELQSRIESDLELKVNNDCNADKYMDAFDYMSSIVRKLGNDAYVEKLMKDKQAGLVLYVDTEAQKIAKQDGKDAAMSFVDKSKAYITDTTMMENIINHVIDESEPVKPTSSDLFSNDYMIPGSDSRYLSYSEISGMSAKELCYARNEIYARHNYIFKANELRQHFASKAWYNGKYTINEFNDSVFNDYEWKNIQLLRDREFSLVPGGFVLDQ